MPTAIELANQFQASLVGDGSILLDSLAPLERATAQQISFLSNPLYRQQAVDSAAGALIVGQADLDYLQANAATSKAARVYFLSRNPYATFARMAQYFAAQKPNQRQPGIHPQAAIDPSATVPASCHIGPFVHIAQGAVLGERVTIMANTTVAAGVRIGDDSLIYPSVSI